MLLTDRCPVCRRRLGSPCPECRELFVPLGPLAPPAGCDVLVAACWYDEAARPLVAGLKYRDQRSSVSFVADLMVAAASTTVAAGKWPGRPDLVTWAPTTAERRLRRGFDHAELLARAVARRWRLPCRPLLTRVGATAQTGRGGAARRHDPPRFEPRRRRPPPSVVLVDDVVTTGATLAGAAGALRRTGASRVVALVAAATPPPSG